MEPNSTASSWLTATNSNFYDLNGATNSAFWTNAGFRKRKAMATDLEEKANQKMFATEEKVIKDMRTLSLEFTHDQSDVNLTETSVDDDFILEDSKGNFVFDEENLPENGGKNSIGLNDDEISKYEFHPLIKENLTKDNPHDALIRKLCQNERKKLTMQLVPFVPIHPAQLSTKISTKTNENDEEESKRKNEKILSIKKFSFEEIQIEDDENLFKRPFIPTAYTVEEPCDINVNRASTMKRSFSQSNQNNGNLLVTELNNDSEDSLLARENSSSYFIVEPSTPISMNSNSSSSLSSVGNSVRISECNNLSTFVGTPNSSNDLDDDIDMQSVASSDTGDKMDDD